MFLFTFCNTNCTILSSKFSFSHLNDVKYRTGTGTQKATSPLPFSDLKLPSIGIILYIGLRKVYYAKEDRIPLPLRYLF